jgi:uncharacterized protein
MDSGMRWILLVFLVLTGSLLRADEFSDTLKKAEQGNAQAQYNLGNMYRYGEGVPRDYAEALKWYRKVAKKGNAHAQRTLKSMYHWGEGVPKDGSKAVEWYREAAEQGDREAQEKLGRMYYFGEGVSEDSKEALKWYQKAADQGSADAQYMLGEMYRDGEGVTKDNVLSHFWFTLSGGGEAFWLSRSGRRNADSEIVELEKRMTSEELKEAALKKITWLTKAAEAGDAEARKCLGKMYRDGDGVPKDNVLSHIWFSLSERFIALTELVELEKNMTPEEMKEAANSKILRKIAEAGDLKAQVTLGLMYRDGNGVPKDYKEAWKWYQKAADQGEKVAQYNLRNIYDEAIGCLRLPDYSEFKEERLRAMSVIEEALNGFHKVAEKGHPFVQCQLGRIYRDGHGVSKNLSKAAEWYRKAAEQGDREAQKELGDIYYVGEDGVKDYREALKWYQKAAEAGDPSAGLRLGKMYRDGEGVPKDKVLSYFWFILSERFIALTELVELKKNMTPEEMKEAANKTITWLRKAAEAGNSYAGLRLGQMYRDGDGVPKDNVLSHFWFSLAMRDYGESEVRELEKNMTPEEIKEVALKKLMRLKKAAEAGDSSAQKSLGEMYRDGDGVPKDNMLSYFWFSLRAVSDYDLGMLEERMTPEEIKEAANKVIAWLRKAAEAGNAEAREGLGRMYCHLGDIYRSGDVVLKDYKEAAKWFQKAAEQGDSEAQERLGFMYFNGQGVPKDYKESRKWYQKAAEQGRADAQAMLGAMYYDGTEYAEARKWLQKAADQRNRHAQNVLGVMYYNGKGVPKDHAEALKWYRKSAKRGNEQAQYNLGFMYYNGQGAPKDYAEALKWYQKAAKQGGSEAQHNLGVIYANGQGVTKDYVQSYVWLSIAAANGREGAQSTLGNIEKRMTPDQIEEAQREAKRLFEEIKRK